MCAIYADSSLYCDLIEKSQYYEQEYFSGNIFIPSFIQNQNGDLEIIEKPEFVNIKDVVMTKHDLFCVITHENKAYCSKKNIDLDYVSFDYNILSQDTFSNRTYCLFTEYREFNVNCFDKDKSLSENVYVKYYFITNNSKYYVTEDKAYKETTGGLLQITDEILLKPKYFIENKKLYENTTQGKKLIKIKF